MNLLKACKFAVKDTKKFDRLAAKLIECIESLLKMCSERAADVSGFDISPNRGSCYF